MDAGYADRQVSPSRRSLWFKAGEEEGEGRVGDHSAGDKYTDESSENEA